MATLNEVFSKLSVRRRYEVWFLRLGLADGSGAWWFRYLLLNPGRAGCDANSQAQPVQIWASWFPVGGKPQNFIQGFPLSQFDLSSRGQTPFHFRVGDNSIEEDSCRGELNVDGHQISWNLGYRSSLSVTLSSKGWIGFSRTPHSDAFFPAKSFSTTGVSWASHLDSECRATIADIGIVSFGLGLTRIFPGPRDQLLLSRH